MRTKRTLRYAWLPLALAIVTFFAACHSHPKSDPGAAATTAALDPGAKIYRERCAKCHGANGEGVADKYDDPLFGDRTLESLTRIIARTMPEDDPGTCTGDDAANVAAYIYDAFYSPAARARLQPPRLEMSRLTVRQYETVIADLAGSFRPRPAPLGDEHGLRGQYYSSRNFQRNRRIFERVDPRIDFQFGDQVPDPQIKSNEFSMRWTGSVIAHGTGDYEFAVRTENGVRLWVNNDSKPLIDAWVSSGREPRQHRQTVRLLGGRAYPIQIEYFKFKDKTASLVLEWKAPHRPWETIPARHLSPTRVPETLVVTTSFPADDSSTGYERGTSVSKEWDQATTAAAIEVAGRMVEQIQALAGTGLKGEGATEKLKTFSARLAERAFRRPLTPEQREFFVEKQFAEANDAELAVKRVILLVLKSPRFLYTELPGAPSDDFTVASRLALALWDSLPDDGLWQAATNGLLRTREQVAAQSQRMLKDPRTKAKLRGFFHHWLETEEAEDLSKDTTAFPDFNDAVVADLRASLDLFIEDVVWGESSDYRQLLLANHLYLNERLAKFYGVTPPSRDEFEKVVFDARQRSGVITHPYLLSMFAYHRNSSPIHRGVFLTRNIVGRSLRPPIMAIEFMDGRFDPSLTMREKVSELTRPAACQTCHSVINPLGFSLEHYDAVGRFRTVDNSKPVDATSEYPTLDGKTIRITGARDVAEYAADNPDAHRGFIQQLFHHTVKQPAGAYGPETLENLRRSFAASGFNIQKLLVEIAQVPALHGVETKSKPDGRDVASAER